MRKCPLIASLVDLAFAGRVNRVARFVGCDAGSTMPSVTFDSEVDSPPLATSS